MNQRIAFLAASMVILSAACAVGPNYHRPAVKVPDTFRAPALVVSEAESLADLKWWQVFKDEKLQTLIRRALEQNYDLQDAAARVEAARANLGIIRSNQLPTAGLSTGVTNNHMSQNGSFLLTNPSAAERTYGAATLNFLSFELDIWGKLRRATEAARANLLAAEENRKAVMTTLVSDVAAAYLSLRELDSELDISNQTLALRRESLELIKTRQKGGVSTLLDLRQAEQLVYSASEEIPNIEQQITQTENQISLLMGENPAGVTRGLALTDQEVPPEVPAGLPSALLDRRPDIRAAEQNLIAANAQIGVAKASYFPQISLTGFLGGQSTQLVSLFSGPNQVWNFAPQLTQPIFAAGRFRSNVRLAEAQRQAALAQYQKAIQSAFTEVSDALTAHQKARERREQQELLVSALQDRKRLAYIRYRGGVDTLLNALDADRDLYQAELALSQIKLGELLSVVQLYKSLGGGWN